MSEVVAAFAANVPPPCRVSCCERHGCSVDLGGCSKRRAIVDMDCLAVPLAKGQPRCDYIFVGEQDDTTWVVPIELKSGGIGAARSAQLPHCLVAWEAQTPSENGMWRSLAATAY